MAARDLWLTMADGVQLAATLYLPGGGPVPCLLEALPYRKDDVTYSYASEYERLRDEFGYAVCRLDLRGTGSSQGIATDEYPLQEQDDLVAVIAWLAAQSWCDGNVGMFGTSYSGFNSIQVAMRRPPALKAIVPIYATDDRYTDDVHYMGGARRLLDLVDYPTYMVAMNGLPPVPEIYGERWREEWLLRLEATPPWLLRWSDERTDSAYWRHGSLRPDYGRITAATMLVAGWADGYRNNTLRTYQALAEAGTPARLLIGPWSHMAAERALPGPHLDLTAELASWFDQWLRNDRGSGGRPPSTAAPIVYFARHPIAPAPDLALVEGVWQAEPAWPSPRVRQEPRALGGGVRVHRPLAGTGTAAWNSCAGALPWGQPTDQRFDDAASLTWDWPVDSPTEVLGYARLALRVTVDQPLATVSAKLCDVAPDGTSTLVTRGLLNLTHRGSSTAPERLLVNQPVDIELELEATSWTFPSGHSMRLSVTGMDWPNTVAPPRPVTLTVDGDASSLTLPVCTGPPLVPTPPLPLLPAPPKTAAAASKPPASPPPATPPPATPATRASDQPDVIWRIDDDVLRRHTIATTRYGSTYPARTGQCTDDYAGEVGIDRRDWSQWAHSAASFTLHWAQATVRTHAEVAFAASAEEFTLEIELRAYENDTLVAKREWRQSYPRDLG